MLALAIAICNIELDFHAPVLFTILLGMALGRVVAVVVVENLTHRSVKFGISPRELALISVLSIRGAPTIALALSLPDTLPYVRTLQSAAFIMVAFDLLVTAPSTPWLAKHFANHAPIPPLTKKPIIIPYDL
ncbi:MAG: hypothetical protein HC809_16330 [Gammaproteobacteria bacterium]|nr:hypothetical protein [Gammaproteobacteria bacterium]